MASPVLIDPRSITSRSGCSAGPTPSRSGPMSPGRVPVGNLVVAGGDGNNTLTVTGLSIRGNLTVTNGAGNDSTVMTGLDIGGAWP